MSCLYRVDEDHIKEQLIEFNLLRNIQNKVGAIYGAEQK